MAEMTQERFDELVEYVKREHGLIANRDYHGNAGIADDFFLGYWLAREAIPGGCDADIEFLIDCSEPPWGPGKVPPAIAFDAVLRISCEHIRTEEPMPPRLREWTLRQLNDLNRVPKAAKAGPRLYGRDERIRVAIWDVCTRFGLNPTRNDEPDGLECCAKRGSACDVVGAVAGSASRTLVASGVR